MIKIIFNLFCLFSLICFGTNTFAASVAGDVREGNRLFEEKKIDEAIAKYSEAQEEAPDSDIVHYNLGAAHYKKGNYEEAIESFTRALSTDDRDLESKAAYNLANSKYRLGAMKAGSDMQGSASLYRESLDYYRRAMELNERDRDAKYNHEVVEKELKILMDRMKQQQEEDQEQNGNQDQGKEQEGEGKESRPESSQEEQQDKQQAKEQESQKGGSEETKEEEGPQVSSQESPQDNQQKGEEGDQEIEMSPEEARMLLESYGLEEAREEVNKQMRGRSRGVLKDW
jgi:tetratricopeptide (TPR) repeat protein